MMTTTDVSPFATATEMLGALRRRDLSAAELLEIHLRRIERHNLALNAIVIPDYDNARRAAEAADAARSRGEDRPLLGLPITIKEAINVAGLRTTVGMPETADWVSPVDGLVTARARAAGAVIVGKTNVPPMLADWQASNPVFGRSNNPWDPARTPGGSTGGGAAAVAAGLSPLEYGSDIGGSIRVPAAYCGIYGHRPSETVVPRSGQFPAPPLPNAAFVMGVQGPLARSAEDIELGLDVVAGPEIGEEPAWRLALPPARHERLADFRVAVLPLPDWLPLDADLLAARDALVATLQRSGARVGMAAPEVLADPARFHAGYAALLLAQLGARMPPDAASQIAAGFAATDPRFGDAYRRGLEASTGTFLEMHAEREMARASFRDFFKDWDVLLCPAALGPAFPHGEVAFPPIASLIGRTLTLNDTTVPYVWNLTMPGIATFPGQPATAFPVGLTRDGLPLGLQAVGPYLEDRTPIRFAALVAREIGGFRPPPGYDD
jgi:amidase